MTRDDVATVANQFAMRAYGCRAVEVVVKYDGGGKESIIVPRVDRIAAIEDRHDRHDQMAPQRLHQGKEQETVNEPNKAHSPDFRMVIWYGVRYAFTPYQAAVIGVLWGLMESGVNEVGQSHLLGMVGSECRRLQQIFDGHPAWKVFVVEGSRTGMYRLAPAPQRGNLSA
jgi:hypothetical protein